MKRDTPLYRGRATAFALFTLSAALLSKAAPSVTGWNASGIYEVPPTTDAVAVAASGMWPKLSVVLRADGTLSQWNDTSGLNPPALPQGLTGVTGFVLNSGGGVAWKADGTVASWGSTTGGIPAGITGVVQVALGWKHGVYLKRDGRVQVSGLVERYVQSQGFVDYNATAPPGLPRLTRVAAAGALSFGLTAEGKVVMWSHTNSFEVLNSISGVSSIVATGGAYGETGGSAAAAKVLGTAFDGTGKSSAHPPLPGSDLVAVAATPSSSLLQGDAMLALRQDGTVASWSPFLAPPGLTNVAALAVGEAHGLAIVGDPAQPPRVIGPASAIVLHPGAAGAARVWYQCRAINMPQSWSAAGLPPGLTLDPASGRVSGIPAESGEFDTVFTATNAAGTGQKTVRFFVDRTVLPQVHGGTITANQDQPFTWNIGVADDPWPASSFETSTLPPGLTLNSSTGIISGAPTSNFPLWNITLKATNAAGTSTANLAMTVVKLLPEVSGGSRTAARGLYFYHRIVAGGGPHSSYGATPLPSGLVINPLNGEIRGRPEVAGEYDITLSAVNGQGTGTAVLHLSVTAPPSPGPDLVVTTLADEQDSPAGPARSLREAIRDVLPGGVIRIAPALLGQTFTLAAGQLSVASREFSIRAAAPGIAISGNNSMRILEIASDASVELQRVSLRQGLGPASQDGGAVWNRGEFIATDCVFSDNGLRPGADGGVASPVQHGLSGGDGGRGGAIYSEGAVRLLRSRFSSNRAGNGGKGGVPGDPSFEGQQRMTKGGPGGKGGSGGAIYSAGTLTIDACEFIGNAAGSGGQGGPTRLGGDPVAGSGGSAGNGGAILGTVFCTNSYFSQNVTGDGGAGGGIGSGSATPGEGNFGGSGGAISGVNVTLINCTLERNATGRAGAPSNANGAYGSAVIASGILSHCTVTANVSRGIAGPDWQWYPAGGAVYGGSGLTVENSIIAANTREPGIPPGSAYLVDSPKRDDVDGTPVLAGANLIGVYGETAGPLNGTVAAPLSPGLLAPVFNGGPTRTMRLAANSPARNAALSLAATPATDQRGYPRVAGAAADLGALEEETAVLPEAVVRDLTFGRGATGWELRWGAAAGTYTVQDSTGLAAWANVPGVTVTFDPATGTATANVPFSASPRRFFRLTYLQP